MGVRAILSEVALALGLIELAHLSLIIVVGNIEHFVLNLDRKWLYVKLIVSFFQ